MVTSKKVLYFGLMVLSAATPLGAKNKAGLRGPGQHNMFKGVAKTARALSSSDISDLSTALSSTSAGAGDAALSLISDLAQAQANIVNAVYSICVGLTTADSTHGNATPISLATTAVKKVLSTGIIPLLNDDYNFTLLHFVGLFSVFGNTVNAATDIKTPSATIISAIMDSLSSSEKQTATTAADIWGSTPVHYVLMSPDTTQLAVINAILPDSTIKNTVLSTANTYGYTPVHYAAMFMPKAKNSVKAVFLNLTSAQKLTALTTADQWSNTPMHYAALFKNVGIFDKTFLSNLTAAQRITALSVANNWGFKPTHCATFDDAKVSVVDPALRLLTKAQILALPFAMPTPNFEVLTVLAPHLLLPQ